MIIMNMNDAKETKIETFPCKGNPYEVKNVWIRWLSQAGPKESPEYGLRFFTVGPSGEIPIHNHFYIQTMYILSGRFECYQFDPKTDQKTKSWVAGPGDSVVVPSMEPHGMRNLSETEPATFLCCICNVYEKETV